VTGEDQLEKQGKLKSNQRIFIASGNNRTKHKTRSCAKGGQEKKLFSLYNILTPK